MRRIAQLLVFFSAALAGSRAARADSEVWVSAEARVPIVQAPRPAFPRVDWRVLPDFRWNRRSEGLAQAFFRTGPLFFVTDWMFVGLHGVGIAERLKSGAFSEEARLELEPNLFGRLGDFTFNDRNRLEYRWRESEVRYRYRNQLRLTYAPQGATWIPFVQNEVMVDLSGLGFNQNRFNFGVGRALNPQARLDLGFMVRSRKDQDVWSHDGVFTLFLFLDAPRAAAAKPVEPSSPHAPLGHAAHHHHGAHGAGPLVHRFERAEDWAPEFDDPGRDAWQRPAEVVAAMRLSPGMTAVDLGAGTGYFLPHLARAVGPSGAVIGLDVETDMVRYMTERAAREGLANVTARRVPHDDPALPESSVDRILIVDTWHHIPDRARYAARLRAALKPGGAVFVVDFTETARRGPARHHRIPPDQVAAELREAGLEVEIAAEDLPEQYIVIGRRTGP